MIGATSSKLIDGFTPEKFEKAAGLRWSPETHWCIPVKYYDGLETVNASYF
jgi:hypothetical protein